MVWTALIVIGAVMIVVALWPTGRGRPGGEQDRD
jgi:hypothetical protein